MQNDDSPLTPSADGILFVSAWSVEVRVLRGHLRVTARTGRDVAEFALPKVGRPRLRRVVIASKGGFITWESYAWLRGIGASLVQMDLAGNVLAASLGTPGPSLAALRRAQVEAANDETGLRIVKDLLGRKLDGQAANLQRFHPDPGAAGISAALGTVERATSIADALAAEARAASLYWGALADLPMRFARADIQRVPRTWLTLTERHSPLSSSPRSAVTAGQALINYSYGLAEYACSLALTAMGLDPGLGWAHRDTAYRDSAALDLMEAVRPDIDAFVFSLLAERTFSAREFIETPTGSVRLAPSLAKIIAESALVLAERRVAPIAEEVARVLAVSAVSPVTVRTRLTQADRKRGRRPASTRMKKVPPVCRLCGASLNDLGRAICDACLPTYDAERTKKLAAAGKETLRAMRASPNDPARTPAARAKLAETSRASMKAIRAWEREHGKVIDRAKYEGDILPVIKAMTVPDLMAATGLSQHYCWQVRSGRKRLHPMHWEVVAGSSRVGEALSGG